MLLFGVDRAAEFRDPLTGRVALLTASAGQTRDNRSTADVLKSCCNLQLPAPGHGIRDSKGSQRLCAEKPDCFDTPTESGTAPLRESRDLRLRKAPYEIYRKAC